jgi:hypothetical protein
MIQKRLCCLPFLGVSPTRRSPTLRDHALGSAKRYATLLPTSKQTEVKFDMEALRLAIASGRGIGKSALVSWLILWMLTTRIGSSVIVSANSEAQLRSVTWGELTKWQAMIINNHWWEISATKLVPAKWITELVERDLKKGYALLGGGRQTLVGRKS